MSSDPAPARAEEPARPAAGFRRLLEHAPGVFALFIAIVFVPGLVLRGCQRESRFSAELLVYEVQFNSGQSTGLLPTTLLNSLGLEGFTQIHLPWGKREDDSIVEERRVEGSIQLHALERIINLSGIEISEGTRVLIAPGAEAEEVQVALRPSAAERSPPLEISVGGLVRVVGSGLGSETIQFGRARSVVAQPSPDLWSARLTLADPTGAVLYPSLAVSTPTFRVTDDLVDSRARGRLEESSIRSGTIRIHGVDGRESTLYSREELDLSRATELFLDEVKRVPDGIRIFLRGLTPSLTVARQGEVEELVPSWLEYTYLTEGGRLLMTVLFAFVVIAIEFSLDRLSDKG